MATLAEINDILTDNVPDNKGQKLREKVGAACDVAASIIVRGVDTGSPWDQDAGEHEKRIGWVKLLFSSHDDTVRAMTRLAVGANATATQAAILDASDVSIKDDVNVAINALASNVL